MSESHFNPNSTENKMISSFVRLTQTDNTPFSFYFKTKNFLAYRKWKAVWKPKSSVFRRPDKRSML